MKMWIDESDGKSMFISVPMKQEGDYFSFDWTTKGHRIMVQRLVASDLPMPEGEPDGEWNTLVVDDGVLVDREHNVWFDFDKEDLVDGQNWLQVKEWPIDEHLAKRMRSICHAITMNQDNLDRVAENVRELEGLIRQESDRLGVELLD